MKIPSSNGEKVKRALLEINSYINHTKNTPISWSFSALGYLSFIFRHYDCLRSFVVPTILFLEEVFCTS